MPAVMASCVLCDTIPTREPVEVGLKTWCFSSDGLELTRLTGLHGLSLKHLLYRAVWKIQRDSGGRTSDIVSGVI